MTATVDALGLLRLLQLASPALPVGAYAYSQGLEWAVECGWVHDEASLGEWLRELLDGSLGQVDLPLLARLHAAALAGDATALERWSAHLLASRETRELRADDCARGTALARLLHELGVPGAGRWRRGDTPYATPLALAAHAWHLPLGPVAQVYGWGWLENQVIAGVKLVPLGQSAGQRLLFALAARLPAAIDWALAVDDDDIGGTVPALAIASSRHETQYTRLFRS